MDRILQKRGVRLTLLLLVIAGAFYGAYQLSGIFAPLLFSFIVAYVLDPIADALERRKFTRLAAVIVIFLVGTVIIVSTIAVSGFYLSRGAINLVESIRGEPRYTAEEIAANPMIRTEQLTEIPDGGGDYYHEKNHKPGYQPGYFVLSEAYIDRLSSRCAEGSTSRQIFDSVENWLVAKRTEFGSEEKRAELIGRVEGWIEAFLAAPFRPFISSDEASSVAEPPGDDSRSLFSSLFTWFSWMLLCPLYIFYLLLEIDPLVDRIRSFLPGRHRDKIVRIVGKIDRTMAAFFRGRITICVVKGIGTSIGLLIFGVPFAIPLGIAAGFLALVPYIGIWFAIIPSVILVWLETQSFGSLVGVAAIFAAMETIEGFWMVPKFLGKEVGLHPLTVIVTMLIFGEVLGFIGVLLSVPLAAIGKILAEEFILPLIEEFAAEEKDPPLESAG